MAITLETLLQNLPRSPRVLPGLKEVEKAIFTALGISVVFRIPPEKEFISSPAEIRELSKHLHSSFGEGKEVTVARWKEILSEFIVYEEGARGLFHCATRVAKNCIEIISPLGGNAAGNTRINNVRFFKDDVAK